MVSANLLAATKPAEQVAGEVFNIAAGGQTSLNDLVEMLQEITGKNIKPAYTEPRPGDIKHSRADIQKAYKYMDYTSHISLLNGLQKTVEWYRNHHE